MFLLTDVVKSEIVFLYLNVIFTLVYFHIHKYLANIKLQIQFFPAVTLVQFVSVNLLLSMSHHSLQYS